MNVCVACSGRGKSTAGNTCKPCGGLGVGPWVSPSQLSTFDDDSGGCNMKWYLGTVAGHRLPQKPSAKLGTDVHAVLEHYMRTGKPIAGNTREERIALKALPMLPPPRIDVRLEEPLWLPREGFGYRGIADIVRPLEHEVQDHKTSSNPRRYGLKAKDLPQDLQANIYAGSLIAVYGWPQARLQWNYLPTDDETPGYPIKGCISKDHNDRQLSRIDAIADKLIRSKSLPIASIATNSDACDSYGGCGYRNNGCPLTKKTSTFMGALAEIDKESTTMAIDPSILARIRAAGAGAGAQQTATPAATQAAATPQAAAPAATPAASNPLDAMKARLQAKAQAAAAAPAEAQAAAAEAVVPQAAAAPMPRGMMAQAKANDAAAAMQAAPGRIGRLYVNCLPIGAQGIVDANDLVAQANAHVCEVNGVAHYKCVEYGKGPGELAAALAMVIAELPEGTDVMAFRVADNEALNVLRLCATEVITALT